jgi:hypothetical protein
MIERGVPEKPADNSYFSELDLQTIGEDKKYQEEVLERHPTVFFRPGDRSAPDHPAYFRADVNGLSYIGFIEEYGSDALRQPPKFLPERIPVRVMSREPKMISEISSDECGGAYEEMKNPDGVLRWLQSKYPNARLTPDSMVTVYKISYEPIVEKEDK